MTKVQKVSKKGMDTRSLTKIAIISAIAYIVMLIEFPIPIFPGFLKLDFSDIPALIGGFAISPLAGVLIQLIKNLLHFITSTTTGGVGELGNFIVGATFIFTASYGYQRLHTKRGALIGCVVATVAMAIVGGFFNYFILIPFYANIMPIEAIIEMGSVITSLIQDEFTLVLYGIVPFNLFKGIVISGITMLIYKKVAPLIKSENKAKLNKR